MKRRIVVLIASFIFIYIFNFSIPRLMPGDPFSYTSSVSGEDITMEFSEEQRIMMEKYYGLDKTFGEQRLGSIQLWRL